MIARSLCLTLFITLGVSCLSYADTKKPVDPMQFFTPVYTLYVDGRVTLSFIKHSIPKVVVCIREDGQARFKCLRRRSDNMVNGEYPLVKQIITTKKQELTI